MSWQWASRRSIARSSGGFTRMSSRISWMFTCLPLSLRAVVAAVWVIIHAKWRQRKSYDRPARAACGRGPRGGRLDSGACRELDEAVPAVSSPSGREPVVPAPGQPVAGPGAGLVVRDVTVRPVVVPLRRPLATRVGDFPRWPLLLI